jgi:hypothetical protein
MFDYLLLFFTIEARVIREELVRHGVERLKICVQQFSLILNLDEFGRGRIINKMVLESAHGPFQPSRGRTFPIHCMFMLSISERHNYLILL